MTLILSGTDGLSDVDGSAATPAIRGTDTNTGIFFPAADTIAFSEGGAEVARFDSSGNLGIGTSSPASRLHLSGNDSTGPAQIKITNTTASATRNIGVSNSNQLVFERAGVATDAVIDSSGNLLVGTTSLANNERLRVIGPGAASSEVVRFENSTNTSGYSGIVSSIQQNGNNTSTWHFRGNTNAVGNWYLFGNGTTSYSSDARLKKNIETTRSGYIEDLCKLRVVKYNWKNDADGTPKELGLIAQEVEQVFAGLVQDDPSKISEDDDTVYKQIKGSVLPFMLLKAIQELKAEVDQLRAQLEAR